MTAHLRLAPVVGCLLLVAASFSSAQETKTSSDLKKPINTPNYYPMQPGNKWVYSVEANGNKGETVFTIGKIEKIDDILLARLEASVNGKVVATEHLRQTDKGIFRYRNNGQECTPPVCLLKYPAKSGSKWTGDINVGNQKFKYMAEAKEETVEVKAGKFKALRVSIDVEENGNNVNTVYWFVNDVGFVRQTIDAGNLSIVMELEKFERAKEKQK